MKEELESEFNIIQQQFENFEKSLQDHVQVQIAESIDFCVENMKNDIKSTKTELEADHESYDILMKRKLEDVKKRMDSEYEDFDERISKVNRELNSRYQAITEQFEADIDNIRDTIRKLDDKGFKNTLNPLDAPLKSSIEINSKHNSSKIKQSDENNIISYILNESGEARVHNKLESLEIECKKLKDTIESHSHLNEEFQKSFDDVYKSLKALNNNKANSEEFIDAFAQFRLAVDKKFSETKLDNIENRKKDMQKVDKGREELIIRINEMYDNVREQIRKEIHAKKTNQPEQILSPERQFNLMFDRDPVKELEKKINKEMEEFKTELIKRTKEYVDGSIESSQIDNQSLFFEIQNKYFDTFKTLVISEAEKQFIPMMKEEIRKEMCKIAFERDTYNSSENERSVALNSQNIKVCSEYQMNMHNHMIIEESRENEDDSHQRTNKDPLTYSQNDDNSDDNYDNNDDSNVDDDIIQLSPPNKLPDSYVESRNSILPSEESADKRENMNIFDGSDSKFPERNRSFQYQTNSQQSSMKKLQNYRNVSQKQLHSQGYGRPNESKVLRERLTDPNNVSHVRSDGSITISHHTVNHSNYDSEKIIYSALKQNAINQGYMPSCIDIEKKKANNENRPINNLNSSGNHLINYGSPVAFLDQSKKKLTYSQMSVDKSNQENISLEDLISKIDSRREFFKKSVREEFDNNFVQRYKTPEFTDSPQTFLENNNSNFLQQSTNDQIVSPGNAHFSKSNLNPDSKDFTIFSNPAFGVYDSVDKENMLVSKEFNPMVNQSDKRNPAVLNR